MFYRPSTVARMWDTWLYYHQGVHYLYYLHETTGACFDGISLATSADGVHFTEIGPILQKRDDAEWLGTGSVWKAGEQFVLNFSEQRGGVQAIFFAVSPDLIHWQRLEDAYCSVPDPRWYDDTPMGRWDCIWALPRDDGGYYGYLTARPWSKTPGISYESVGMVTSPDGLQWHAVPPPVIAWGDWPPMDVGEVGAIAKIGKRYYLMLGFSESWLGDRQASSPLEARHGMYTFVGDSPEGPFRAAPAGHRLLTSSILKHRMMAYFTRFYPLADEVLVNHHSISRSDVRWMAPLKRAVVNAAGGLTLHYWPGNDAAKGKEIAVDLSRSHLLPLYAQDSASPSQVSPQRIEVDQPHGAGLVLLDGHFDLDRGVILEGDLQVYERQRGWAGIGLYVEEDARRESGTAFIIETRGHTEIGLLRRARPWMTFAPDDALPIGIRPGEVCHFRLLVRQFLVELYLDDRLIQCYSLPEVASGRLGLVIESGRAVFERFRAWEMNVHGVHGNIMIGWP